jgi:hypothetical protein
MRLDGSRTVVAWIAVVAAVLVVIAAASPPATGVAADAPAAPAARASFVNDVMPVLTKASCNSGPCHAKAGLGQNGFRLSVLGFEPAEDYDHIVNEARGRRISVGSPDDSLLLMRGSTRRPRNTGRSAAGSKRAPRLPPPTSRMSRRWSSSRLRRRSSRVPRSDSR